MAWYKNAQGQPVWVEDKPSVTPVGPRNPRLPAQVQGDILGNANTAATTGRTVVQTRGDQIDNATKAATQQAIIAKANADALTAQNTARGITPEFLQQQMNTRKALAPLGSIIDDLQRQYERNFRGSGGTSGRGVLAEILPGSIMGRTVNSANDVFNSTAMRAGPFIKPFVAPGGKDADAAAEYQQKVMPFIPQAGDSDAKIESKINQLRALYNRYMGVKSAPAKKPASQVIDFNHWGQ